MHFPLQWRHNERDGVSNHQPHDRLLNGFGRRSKKHQSYVSLAFVRGIYRSPVSSPHKGSVTRKTFPFDDAIMNRCLLSPVSLYQLWPYIVHSRYLAVSFAQTTQKRHSLPFEAWGRLFLVHSVNKVVAFFISYCVQYCVILNGDISKICSTRFRTWSSLCLQMS